MTPGADSTPAAGMANPPVVAWRVSLDEYEGITYAETKSKAKWNAVRSARSAGIVGRYGFPSSLDAVREESLDRFKDVVAWMSQGPRGVYTEAFIRGWETERFELFPE